MILEVITLIFFLVGTLNIIKTMSNFKKHTNVKIKTAKGL